MVILDYYFSAFALCNNNNNNIAAPAWWAITEKLGPDLLSGFSRTSKDECPIERIISYEGV